MQGWNPPRVPCSNPHALTFEILNWEGGTLLFDERCSSSHCQQQCVILTQQGRKVELRPHDEPSSCLWLRLCLGLILCNALVILCLHQSQHHVWNYSSLMSSSQSSKGQRPSLLLRRFFRSLEMGFTLMLVDVLKKCDCWKGLRKGWSDDVGGSGVLGMCHTRTAISITSLHMFEPSIGVNVEITQ